jgi:hypothetical protein
MANINEIKSKGFERSIMSGVLRIADRPTTSIAMLIESRDQAGESHEEDSV